MRGGYINKEKVKAFNRLLFLLCSLNAIKYKTFVKLYLEEKYFNPLMSDNKLFIDPF